MNNIVFYHSSPKGLDAPGHLVNWDKWLPKVMKQVRYTNPEANIYLICNDNISFPEVEHVHTENLCHDRLERFREKYVHMSTNSIGHERPAIERWLCVSELLHRLGDQPCVFLEVDVLVYEDVTEWFKITSDYDMTYTLGHSGNCTIINNPRKLHDLASYIENAYIDRDATFTAMKGTFDRMQANGYLGGICDMTFLRWFASKDDVNVLDHLEKHKLNGKVFDDHIRFANDWNATEFILKMDLKGYNPGVEMKFNHKDIQIRNKQPYCYNHVDEKEYQFRLLHFVGHSKLSVDKYITYEEMV